MLLIASKEHNLPIDYTRRGIHKVLKCSDCGDFHYKGSARIKPVIKAEQPKIDEVRDQLDQEVAKVIEEHKEEMSLEEFKVELAEAKINGPTNLISSKRVLINTKPCSCANIHQHFTHDNLVLKDLGGTGDCVFRVL